MVKFDDNLPDFSDLELPEDDSGKESPFALPEATDEGGRPEADVFVVDESAQPEATEPAAVEEEAPPAEEKAGFLQKLEKISPYTVMLVMAFIAVAIGALLMFLELKSYDFDYRAKDAPRASAR